MKSTLTHLLQWGFRKHGTLIGAIATAALLGGNIHVGLTHQWGKYHWDKSGSYIEIKNFNYASNWDAAEAARVDGWNTIRLLYNYNSTSHTEVSVFDADFGNIGWRGLATLEDLDWAWHCFSRCHIAHAHAKYNTFYGSTSQQDIQGVFCQEIGHTWGLDHSDTGDCMGKGYFNNENFYGPHNNDDFTAMYQNH